VSARISAYLFVLMLGALVAPAGAHVTISPPELRAGSVDEITFRCPDERANSATTKLVIQMPQDHPIASVKLRPVPGWHSSVTMRRLDAPVKTEHGEIVAAVNTITWAGGAIAPGEYQDFAILAGPIPSGARQLVFKAVQTYANGEVVRWIELRHTGEAEPEHPAPILNVR
jgi:periplasmic copper chaperone A